MKTLEEARAYLRQEMSNDTADIWGAILEIHKTLAEAGKGLPDSVVAKAEANLIRAGVLVAGDFSDDQLTAMATADGVRVWAADLGMIFANEPIIGPDHQTYICTTQHRAQADWAPGTIGGRTLFRPLRKEPEAPGEYLDFVWGEHVEYGHVRRDPIDGKLYTPIKEAGVTLYEPHYPHLVPSEYALYDEPGPAPGPSENPDWDDLEPNHLFNIGDRFTCDGQLYEVLRQFNKQDGWKPPALSGDFYQPVAAAASVPDEQRG